MIRERCSRNRRGSSVAARLTGALSGTIVVVRRLVRRPRSSRRDGRRAIPPGRVIPVECLGEGEAEIAVPVRISLPEPDSETTGCCMRIRLVG